MLYNLGERRIERSGRQFIAPSASVIGSVVLEDEVSLWFNVVVRADNDIIRIGAGTNIQDGSVLHVDPGYPLTIGRNVTVGHQVILHGCIIGDGSLVGMNAVILNGARIGAGCLVGANALVTEKMEIPDGSLVLGSPARIVRTLDSEERQKLLESARRYVANSRRYGQQLAPVDPRGLASEVETS